MTNEDETEAFKPLPIMSLAEVVRLEEGLSRSPVAQEILAQHMADPDKQQFGPAELRLSMLRRLWPKLLTQRFCRLVALYATQEWDKRTGLQIRSVAGLTPEEGGDFEGYRGDIHARGQGLRGGRVLPDAAHAAPRLPSAELCQRGL